MISVLLWTLPKQSKQRKLNNRNSVSSAAKFTMESESEFKKKLLNQLRFISPTQSQTISGKPYSRFSRIHVIIILCTWVQKSIKRLLGDVFPYPHSEKFEIFRTNLDRVSKTKEVMPIIKSGTLPQVLNILSSKIENSPYDQYLEKQKLHKVLKDIAIEQSDKKTQAIRYL